MWFNEPSPVKVTAVPIRVKESVHHLVKTRTTTRMSDNNDDTSCGVNGGGNYSGNAGSRGRVINHDVFGDGNLGAMMMILILLHLMQHAMRDPCSC